MAAEVRVQQVFRFGSERADHHEAMKKSGVLCFGKTSRDAHLVMVSQDENPALLHGFMVIRS